MDVFSSWAQLPTQSVGSLERKIFTGQKGMLVRNEIAPKAVVPLHQHPHEQLIFVAQGQCDVTVGEETRHLTAGSLVLVESNVPHQVVNTEEEVLVALDFFAPIREDFLK